MTPSRLARLAPLAFALLPLACVTGAAEPTPRNAEPLAPLPEFRTQAPNPGMVWIPGAWHLDGLEQVWLPGHWAEPTPVP